MKILKESVKKVGDRYPRNAEYAGKIMDVEEISNRLAKYYKGLGVENFRNHYQHGIPFTAAGFPDFSRYAVKKVRIELTGDRKIDFVKANKAANLTETPKGYTCHHHEDGKTMLLVPTDLHAAIGHTGGFAKFKK